MTASVQRAVVSTDWIERFDKEGIDPSGMGAEEFRATISREIGLYRDLATDQGGLKLHIG